MKNKIILNTILLIHLINTINAMETREETSKQKLHPLIKIPSEESTNSPSNLREILLRMFTKEKKTSSGGSPNLRENLLRRLTKTNLTIDQFDEETLNHFNLSKIHVAICLKLTDWIAENKNDYIDEINIQAPDFDLPLIAAIDSNSDIKTISDLLKNGADPNKLSLQGFTSLFHALSNGRKDVFELLLSFGANINQRFTKGETILSWAFKKNNITTIHFLIERGATFYSLPANIIEEIKAIVRSNKNLQPIYFLQTLDEMVHLSKLYSLDELK